MEQIKIKDMPKLHSPFVRKMINGNYIVTDEITEGMEWVFEDESVMAIEKLSGTNVSIVIQEGTVISIFNRTERVPFINKGKKWLIEGILNSKERGYLEFLGDGQHFGELIGPRVNKNPYKIDEHLWIPFSGFGQKHLRFKCWGKYPKTFGSISEWFKELMPLYSLMKESGHQIIASDGTPTGKYHGFIEGIVFTHPDGRMAKLRKNMFEWAKEKRHKI